MYFFAISNPSTNPNSHTNLFLTSIVNLYLTITILYCITDILIRKLDLCFNYLK